MFAPFPPSHPIPRAWEMRAERALRTGKRRRGGFSLVEVVLALGLFAFAVVPLTGLLGGGLTMGRDAAQDFNMAQIFRQAAAKADANPYADTIDPMYFTFAAQETTSGDANAVYKLTFSNAQIANTDAAAGLIARKQWKIEVFSPPSAAGSVSRHFVAQSREPVDTTSTGSSDPQIKLYPLIGADVALPIAAEASRWGLGASGDYTDLRPAIAPTTIAFNGGRLTIRIFPGSGNTFSGNDLIQEIEVNFPGRSFPVPFITRSRFGTGGTADFAVAKADNNIKNTAFYAGFSGFAADSRKFNERMQCTIDSGAGARNMPSLIRRGDVLRSVYLDPAGPSRGDPRVVAAQRHVPSTFFTTFPGYTDTATILQACAGGVRGTTVGLARRSSIAYGSARLDKNPDSFNNQPNRPDSDYQGTPLPFSYYYRARPNVPFNLSEAPMGTLLGDLNTRVGGILDGPYISLADQGFVSDQSKQYYNIYYPSNAGDSTSAQAITTFSPNRQVSSPVIFGSMPSGITPLANFSDSGTQAPWRTLLFCPTPAAKSAHPGFSNPPDHLFLDNFWMPTVEPYAISEPLATAGKINLNYQIEPFGYIERSTGLHAGLNPNSEDKEEKMKKR